MQCCCGCWIELIGLTGTIRLFYTWDSTAMSIKSHEAKEPRNIVANTPTTVSSPVGTDAAECILSPAEGTRPSWPPLHTHTGNVRKAGPPVEDADGSRLAGAGPRGGPVLKPPKKAPRWMGGAGLPIIAAVSHQLPCSRLQATTHSASATGTFRLRTWVCRVPSISEDPVPAWAPSGTGEATEMA